VTGAAVVDDPRSHVVWPRRVTRDECRRSVGAGPGAVVIQVHRQRYPRSPAPALEQIFNTWEAGRRVGGEVAGEQQQPAGVHLVVEGLRGRTAEDSAGPPRHSLREL